ARSGSRRLAAFAVPFLLVLLENGPRGHFLGALAISSFFLGRLEDVLVLALLFGSDAAYMFPARQNCPPDGCSLSGMSPGGRGAVGVPLGVAPVACVGDLHRQSAGLQPHAGHVGAEPVVLDEEDSFG